MTNILFIGEPVCGFNITGHSTVNVDDLDGKLVCSAISSAAYLVANTITDVFCDDAEISVGDGELYFKLITLSCDSIKLLEGFKLHIENLAEQYSKRLTIISEV